MVLYCDTNFNFMNKIFSTTLALSASAIFVFTSVSSKAQSGTSCSSAINIPLSTTNSTCLNESLAPNEANGWFKFTAIRSVTNFKVTNDVLQPGSINGAHVFTGTCNDLIEMGASVVPDDGGFTVFLNFLSIGQTYYIRLDKSLSVSTAAFVICSSPASQLPWQVSGGNVEFSGSLTAPTISTASLDVSQRLTVSGSELTHTVVPGFNEGTYIPYLKMSNTMVDGILDVTTRLNFAGTGAGLSYSPGTVLPGLRYPGTLLLSANTYVNGSLDIGQAKLGFVASNGTNPNVFSLGNSNSAVLRNSACFNTNPNSFVTQTPDLVQITSNYFTSQNNNNINLMTMGYDGANDIIESEGHRADNNKPSLLLNYYCGYDVGICTGGGGSGTSGGFVFTGPNLQIGNSNQHRDNNVALSIGSTGTTGIKLLDINNNTNFLVNSDGTVAFGGGGIVPAGYQMAVYGKIITKEVVVKLLPWPDYVFSKNYNLKGLDEVEKYIKQNNHLPNIPSALEVEKNGVQLGDMMGKQMEKIEELTLYMIEMKKEIEKLKKENEILKAAIVK